MGAVTLAVGGVGGGPLVRRREVGDRAGAAEHILPGEPCQLQLQHSVQPQLHEPAPVTPRKSRPQSCAVDRCRISSICVRHPTHSTISICASHVLKKHSQKRFFHFRTLGVEYRKQVAMLDRHFRPAPLCSRTCTVCSMNSSNRMHFRPRHLNDATHAASSGKSDSLVLLPGCSPAREADVRKHNDTRDSAPHQKQSRCRRRRSETFASSLAIPPCNKAPWDRHRNMLRHAQTKNRMQPFALTRACCL